MGHQGHLPTRKREHLSRKLDKNVDHVQIPRAAELAVADHFDSGYFKRFQSREGIFNQTLEALQDDNISRVALYGEIGSGNKTLAKQVGKRVKELNIFNIVVVVHVTEIPNVKRIQGDIADQLGLRLGGEADLAARQTQLTLRLRNEERVLIILDDVQAKLDLQRIGISNDGGHMGWKVLLTTDSREVGYLMGCQLSLHLYLLTDDEAWHLMMKRAGIDDGSPDLISAAIEVTKHCNESPLAISVIGSALRGKAVDQWVQVLTTLRSPTEDSKWAYWLEWFRILQVGYNGQSSKVAKAIFIICGFFPGGHEILIEDLSQYAIGLGLCSNNEVRAAINTLKESSLLMHSDTSNDHVMMHVVVHYAAMVIAYRENPTYGGSIDEYINALYNEEDFEWHEELDRLLRQLYGVTEPSSTSNATFHGGEGRERQVVPSYSYTKAATTIPKPSGRLVNFKGLCRVDKSFLPLLQEAYDKNPQLIESQRRHSEILKQTAFECLGRMLFLLHNVRIRDLLHHKKELQMFWEQAQLMKFDLEWLNSTVEGVFSSPEIAEIEALREQEKYWNEEAAKLREQLNIIEDKAATIRTKIALKESMLNGFAIANVSKGHVVSKLTPGWKKIFFKS